MSPDISLLFSCLFFHCQLPYVSLCALHISPLPLSVPLYASPLLYLSTGSRRVLRLASSSSDTEPPGSIIPLAQYAAKPNTTSSCFPGTNLTAFLGRLPQALVQTSLHSCCKCTRNARIRCGVQISTNEYTPAQALTCIVPVDRDGCGGILFAPAAIPQLSRAIL
eukprot:1130988-Rhodomonas_salina.1